MPGQTKPNGKAQPTENYFKNAKAVEGSPDTFTIPEADAIRLKEMAMSQSNKEMTPEMENAMNGINGAGDLSKIPTKTYNQICYDEASKTIQKASSDSKEFIESVVPEEAVRDIFTEDIATEKMNNFDFGDITEYLKNLDSLSFFEAVSYRKKIDAEIARWKSCKAMVKAVQDIRINDGSNRDIMLINTLKDYNMDENKSIEDFLSSYDDNMDKLTQISTRLAEIVYADKDNITKTSFLTSEMLISLNKKLNALNPSIPNYEYNKIRIERVIEAFSHRLNITYLDNKFTIYLITNKKNITKSIRQDIEAMQIGRRIPAVNDIIRLFSEDIAYAVYNKLMDIFENNAECVYIMLNFLAKVMNTEKKSCYDAYAKVFILNLADIYNGTFDLPEKELYLKIIQDNFLDDIKNFIITTNFQVNKGFVPINYTFGLRPATEIDNSSSVESTESESTIEETSNEVE